MAAIDDLISQIENRALRDRLKSEVERIAKEKKFGLVFEEHLPELTPIFSANLSQVQEAIHAVRAIKRPGKVLLMG